MQLRKRIPALLLVAMNIFIVAASTAWGNGGPIDNSFVLNSGDIRLVQQKNISIDEELLSIRFDGDYADVKVKYRFNNKGAEEIVKYAFPVDIDMESEFFEAKDWEKNCLPVFRMEDESGRLPVKSYLDKQKIQCKVGDEVVQATRKWYATELHFPANRSKEITVTYRVRCLVDDWGFSKDFFAQYSSRFFQYALSPSGNWGAGIVKKFRVEVDIRDIRKNGVIKQIKMPGYQDSNGILIWEKYGFNLAKAAPIEIVFDNSPAKLTKDILKARIQSTKFKLQASSSLKGYPLNNLVDGDLNTAWAEGSEQQGIGEWIEVDFEPNTFLGLIAIINGYTKDESTFLNNGSIKKVKLRFEYWDSQEKPEEEIIELKPSNYSQLNKAIFYPFVNVLWNGGDGRLVKKVRLTVLEVYPGLKFTDLCLSELFLAGYNNEPQ